MIKSYKLKDSMFLNMIPVVPTQTSKEPQFDSPVNQYLIFDRSGSMGYYIDTILDVATDYVKKLPDGSTVSIGYFSGTGDYNLSVTYILHKELTGAVKTIDSYRSTIGCTNFIEIINKVADTAALTKSKNNALFFFTDGCHNEGGSYTQIQAALNKWKELAAVTMFVGYGYIDRDMLSRMASTANGTFIHLPSFKEFGNTLNDFGTVVTDTEPTTPVDVKSIPADSFIIALTRSSIVEYERDNNIVNYRPSKSGYKGLYTLTKQPLSKDVEDVSNAREIDITVERGIRAMAYLYSQKNNAAYAMEIMGVLGDKTLIDGLYNSIAPDEFSLAENAIRKSIFMPSYRYVHGKAFGYLPPENAYCIMDALKVLSADETVRLHLNDPDFEYDRIGSISKATDGTKSEMVEGESVNLSSIIMSEERLNVSISTNVKSTVTLDPMKFSTGFTEEDLTKFGIAKKYPVQKYRTYNIIADGRLNTKRLVLSDLAPETLKEIEAYCTARADGKYVLDLTQMPILNKSYLQHTSAATLAGMVWNEKILAETVSVYSYLEKELKLGDADAENWTFDEARNNFLSEKCYIKNGSYNPPVVKVTVNDQYDAYFFSIKMKGFSKEATSAVIKKVRAGEKISTRGKNIADIYKQCTDNMDAQWSKEMKLAYLSTLLKGAKAQLAVVRSMIQGAKLAIVLINKGAMAEFSSREDMQLTKKVEMFDGEKVDVVFVFDIEKKQVNI